MRAKAAKAGFPSQTITEAEFKELEQKQQVRAGTRAGTVVVGLDSPPTAGRTTARPRTCPWPGAAAPRPALALGPCGLASTVALAWLLCRRGMRRRGKPAKAAQPLAPAWAGLAPAPLLPPQSSPVPSRVQPSPPNMQPTSSTLFSTRFSPHCLPSTRHLQAQREAKEDTLEEADDWAAKLKQLDPLFAAVGPPPAPPLSLCIPLIAGHATPHARGWAR